MLVVLLFLIYLMVFIFGLNQFKTRLNPITAFTVGFIACMFVCLLNYSRWEIGSFHFNTFWLLCLGCIGFFSGCLWVQSLYGNKKIIRDTSLRLFEVNSIFLLGYLVVESAIVLYSYKYLITETGADNLSQAALINYHAGFTEGDNSQYLLPFFPRILKSNVIYLNYYFFFILANHLVQRGPIVKILLLSLICLVGSFANLTTGSRGTLIEPFLFFLIVYNFLSCRRNELKKRHFGFIKILLFLLATIIFLIVFYHLGTLFGRDSEGADFMEYISSYIGGQPKNLDMFLNEFHKENQNPGAYTFGDFFSIFMKIRPLAEMSMGREVNGVELGNVYTGFMNYYYDFGLVGTAFFCFLMGAFFQFLYVRSLNCDLRGKYIVFSIFLYAYFLQGLIMNFFGERVCRMISPLTLKCLIFLCIFDYLVMRITRYRIK